MTLIDYNNIINWYIRWSRHIMRMSLEVEKLLLLVYDNNLLNTT